MAERLVLQKLLASPISSAIVETGEDQVGGFVTDARAAVGLRTPAELLAAYGVDGAPEFADVVRFEQPRLTTFTSPSEAERPWAVFPHGFLHGDSLAQVWVMGRTRYSYGAEYWRIRSDGEQKRLSRYEGAARGWVGAKQWRPPSPLVGNMARWRGGEYFADVVGDSVLLTATVEEGPAGFSQVHPRAWSATAPLSECEVFERVYTAELQGVPVRVLRSGGGAAELLLLSDDPADAEQVGAGLVEPGVYELIVDSNRLTNVHGVENVLAPG
ncbi:hypothetical protein VST63_23170 [Mycolicibacterium sp. 050232]|uniref:hypothetical protein n=1 Tax=Mycolicibacterium sp. 050232 TaxID=3113982 RepID=UPI002E2D973A|nr:hypothetical protein [Mycolicibacterium sp. 050232]MED5815272.1 hypothetical protein [Mycolicibacterium sp. 050232]